MSVLTVKCRANLQLNATACQYTGVSSVFHVLI